MVVLALWALLAPAHGQTFEGYDKFYESFPDRIFTTPAIPLFKACTESPLQCIWAKSGQEASRRLHSSEWFVIVPAGQEFKGKSPKGQPSISFDGARLNVGQSHWLLQRAINLAPASELGAQATEADDIGDVQMYLHRDSICIERYFNGSGESDRYVNVLFVWKHKMYALPALFASCKAIRLTSAGMPIYPSNTYLENSAAAGRTGLQMDFLQLDGTTRVERHSLGYPDLDNVFRFEEAVPNSAGKGGVIWQSISLANKARPSKPVPGTGQCS